MSPLLFLNFNATLPNHSRLGCIRIGTLTRIIQMWSFKSTNYNR